MNYSINKLSPLIVQGAKWSIVAKGEDKGGWRMQGFIVSVTLNDIAATLRVMKTTSKVI